MPAWSRERKRQLRNDVNSKAGLFTRLVMLLTASVGPLVKCARRQAAICARQRFGVRPI